MPRKSKEANQLKTDSKKKIRKHNEQFRQMIKNEFPQAKITVDNIAEFLFCHFGYKFDETFQIIERPKQCICMVDRNTSIGRIVINN